jgi:hypothetical protein
MRAKPTRRGRLRARARQQRARRRRPVPQRLRRVPQGAGRNAQAPIRASSMRIGVSACIWSRTNAISPWLSLCRSEHHHEQPPHNVLAEAAETSINGSRTRVRVRQSADDSRT